jgi:hypothetical protein
MRNPIGVLILTAATVTAAIGADADDAQLVFRYTGHETCVGGPPGIFTSGGDVTNYYWMIPALGSGVITFRPLSHAASDANNWAYQIMPGSQPQPNGSPLSIFPARLATGSCVFIFEPGQHKSFTLQLPRAGCTSTDTSGPNNGNTVTFTNGPLVQGQFADDMQSFVAYRIGLTTETGSFASGGQFERICMRELHGVRIPN